MTFILSDLYKSAQSRFATRINIDIGSKNLSLLIDANCTQLSAWMLGSAQGQSQGQHLTMKFSLETGNEVLALTRIESSKNDNPQIAALFDSHIEVFDVTSSAFVSSLVIPFNAVSGHLESLEIDPVLLSYSSENIFLILYRYTGFVTVFNLSLIMKNLAINTTHSNTRKRGRKRGRKIEHEFKTFSIGTVAVLSMAVAESGNKPLIAVLYRDIDFNHSLRYYTFDADLSALTMIKQMEEFSGTPSLVTAVKNGFLVAGDLKMWFFPYAQNSVISADEAGDEIFPVSYSKLHNVATLNLSAHKMSYLGSRFDASCQIDEYRHLLVSDTGTTFLVYIDVETVRAISTLTRFRAIELGKSTIASEIAHFKDNVFYASSRRSRSVLFRILPQSPHIDILSNVTNSSPILDLNFQTFEGRNSILMARGGYHGGELEVLTDTEYKVKQEHVTQVTYEAVSALKPPGSDVVVLKNDSGRILESLHYPNLTQITDSSEVSIGELSCEDPYIEEDFSSWKIDETRTIELRTGRKAQIILKTKESNFLLSLDGLDQVTGLVSRENEHSLEVFMISWDGTLSHVSFSKKAVLVGQSSTGLSGNLSLEILDLEESSFEVIVLNGEGLLYCIPVSRQRSRDNEFAWNLEKTQYLKAKSKHGTFKMSKSVSKGLLIYDSLSLFLLSHESYNCAGLMLSKVHLFTHRIRSCQIATQSENSGRIIVLFEDGTLSDYSYRKRLGKNDSYGSNNLILSSVAISKRYTAALQLQTSPNMRTGQTENTQSLLLFDRVTLELLDVFTPSEPSNFVSICSMNGKYTHRRADYIIVANSTDDPSKLLKVFCVQQNKLVPVDVSINGTMPKSFSLSKIVCYKNTVTVVGDIIISFTLRASKTSLQEVWNSKVISHDGSPFFGVDVAQNSDLWVMADAARGVFVAPRLSGDIVPIRCPFPSSFGSAVTASKTLPIFVYGDSDGNIWAAKLKKHENTETRLDDSSFKSLFFTNLGEQINEIAMISEDPITILVATVKGNVFRVQDLAPQAELQAHVEKLEGNEDVSVAVSDKNKIFRENSFNMIESSALNSLMLSAQNGQMPEDLKIEIAEVQSDLRSL